MKATIEKLTIDNLEFKKKKKSFKLLTFVGVVTLLLWKNWR
jgi:hypothetical protein